MRISPRVGFFASALIVAVAGNVGPASAQETLAGVGAASAAGAGLGAAAAGSISASKVTRNARNIGNRPSDLPESDPTSGPPGVPGVAGGVAPPTITAPNFPALAAGSRGGSDLLAQLLSASPSNGKPRSARSARAQAAYSRRIAHMSPRARKRLVQQKYHIAGNGWLGAYLPQDRYKFSKAWKYVSTETGRLYYRPQDMARLKFSPNRVIGFRTWQDAMLAGYHPDPVSRPEPGPQFAFFASLTRDEPLIRMVEYAYAGQLTPTSLDSTYQYVRQVKGLIDKTPYYRQYQRETVNSILEASLTGDLSRIPTQIGAPPVVQTVDATGLNGAPGQFGGPGQPGQFGDAEKVDPADPASRNRPGGP